MEDDAVLAMSLVDVLKSAGLAVIGPVSNTHEALAKIEHYGPDFAILDINLGKETSERVAVRLDELAIPFICLSAYSSSQLPAACQQAPFLQKPVDETAILSAIKRAIE